MKRFSVAGTFVAASAAVAVIGIGAPAFASSGSLARVVDPVLTGHALSAATDTAHTSAGRTGASKCDSDHVGCPTGSTATNCGCGSSQPASLPASHPASPPAKANRCDGDNDSDDVGCAPSPAKAPRPSPSGTKCGCGAGKPAVSHHAASHPAARPAVKPKAPRPSPSGTNCACGTGKPAASHHSASHHHAARPHRAVNYCDNGCGYATHHGLRPHGTDYCGCDDNTWAGGMAWQMGPSYGWWL